MAATTLLSFDELLQSVAKEEFVLAIVQSAVKSLADAPPTGRTKVGATEDPAQVVMVAAPLPRPAMIRMSPATTGIVGDDGVNVPEF